MHNFTYWSPTEVVFGKDTENQTAAYVKKYAAAVFSSSTAAAAWCAAA